MICPGLALRCSIWPHSLAPLPFRHIFDCAELFSLATGICRSSVGLVSVCHDTFFTLIPNTTTMNYSPSIWYCDNRKYVTSWTANSIEYFRSRCQASLRRMNLDLASPLFFLRYVTRMHDYEFTQSCNRCISGILLVLPWEGWEVAPISCSSYMILDPLTPHRELFVRCLFIQSLTSFVFISHLHHKVLSFLLWERKTTSFGSTSPTKGPNLELT